MVKRRQAFSINLDENSRNQIDKDYFLNSPYSISDSKGMIHFGNQSVELVINMMFGIRNSVNCIGNTNKLFTFIRKDDSFKEFNLFNFTHNTFDKEIVYKINPEL